MIIIDLQEKGRSMYDEEMFFGVSNQSRAGLSDVVSVYKPTPQGSAPRSAPPGLQSWFCELVCGVYRDFCTASRVRADWPKAWHALGASVHSRALRKIAVLSPLWVSEVYSEVLRSEWKSSDTCAASASCENLAKFDQERGPNAVVSGRNCLATLTCRVRIQLARAPASPPCCSARHTRNFAFLHTRELQV